MSGQARILLVDDDCDIIETLKIVLEDNGYAVDTASTGKDAIAKSNANFYNLAIVDWRLPDMEGTALLKLFKETTPKMMKIMLTGFPSIRNAIDAVNAQADAFLEKPIGPEKLFAKISDLLSQQEKVTNFDEQKVAEFINTKASELIAANKVKRNNP
jgi:two-component system response regulator PilR (NtrC family)